MCFNQPWSLFFSTCGFIFALIAHYYLKDQKKVRGVLFFTSMEFLQFIQYFYIDDCDNPINKVLTILGFIHICWQPYFIHNIGFSDREKEDQKTYEYMQRMDIVVAIVLMLRWPLAYPWGDWWEGKAADFAIPSCRAYGWVQDSDNRGVCTFTGNIHLGWSVPLYQPTYMSPSSYLHFFAFFMPYLIWRKWGFTFQKISFVLGILSGPVAAMVLTDNLNEQAAVWCLYSIIIIGTSFIMAAIKKHKTEKAAAAAGGKPAIRSGKKGQRAAKPSAYDSRSTHPKVA